MSTHTISSRQFNQDVSKVKKLALSGPVFITDRGHVAHVLLAIDDYEKITQQQENIVDLLAMPEAKDIDFDPPRLDNPLYKPTDFS